MVELFMLSVQVVQIMRTLLHCGICASLKGTFTIVAKLMSCTVQSYCCAFFANVYLKKCLRKTVVQEFERSLRCSRSLVRFPAPAVGMFIIPDEQVAPGMVASAFSECMSGRMCE